MKGQINWDEYRTLRNIPQSERDKMPDSDFAGPNRSFPIAEPEDVAAAASSLGRLKGGNATQAERDRVKRKIIAIAKRKGASFVAQLPDDWKEKPKAAQSFFERIAQMLGAQAPEEMGDTDLREELTYALNVAVPSFRYNGVITVVYPNQNRVVWQMYEPEGVCYYACTYSLDDNGEAMLNEDVVECERVTTYEPIEAGDELVAAVGKVIALAGARHSAKDQKMIQTMHDTSVSLGADCATMTASEGRSSCGCSGKKSEPPAVTPAAW